MFDAAALMEIMETIQSLHPLFGLLAAGLEAFFAFLPLVAIVAFNVLAYGFWWGYILSYGGSLLGSFALFLLVRYFLSSWYEKKAQDHKTLARFTKKIQKKGFGPIFLLFCFPFTPSFFVSAAAGIADVGKRSFLVALAGGKLVMVFILATIGFQLQDILDHPVRTLLILGIIFLIWFILDKVIKLDRKI